MPSTFAGSGLQSVHKPAIFLEAALVLQAAEKSVPTATRPNNIAVSIDAFCDKLRLVFLSYGYLGGEYKHWCRCLFNLWL